MFTLQEGEEQTMLKRIHLTITAIIIGITFSPALFSYASPQDFMRYNRYHLRLAESNLIPAEVVLKLKDKLNVSAEQENKLNEIIRSFKEEIKPEKLELKKLELSFAKYLKGERIDHKEMEDKLRAIARLEIELQIKSMAYLLAVKSTLNVKQLKIIEALKKEHRKKALSRLRQKKDRSNSVKKK